MAKQKVAKFVVPATSANLGPGFDCLALALNLYDEVEMKLSEGISIQVKGEGEKEIPKDENNLMVASARRLFFEAGKPFPGIEIKLKKSIPMTKGLGSSSAAIATGLFGANELLNSPLSRDELFNLATHMEGHPDNVAAAFYGGFVIAWRENGGGKAVSFSPPSDLKIVLAIPDFQVYTIRARSSLPLVWPKEDVIYSLGRACLLTASMISKKMDWLPSACSDRLHEPYRGQLIPGYEDLRKAVLEAGALGVSISGSGPTVLTFLSRNQEKIQKIMVDVFKKNKTKCVTMVVKPSPHGVKSR